MASSKPNRSSGKDQVLLYASVIALATVILVITFVSIKESRADSYRLLVDQGRAFTEALASASENAIAAETYYDRMTRSRFADLIATIDDAEIEGLTDQDWLSFALTYDLVAAFVYDSSQAIVAGVTARGPWLEPPQFVADEVALIFDDLETSYVMLLDEDQRTGEPTHYYLQLTGRLDRVVVLVTDAQSYAEALRETGIGFLAQKMAREPGVEYIIYQTPEGIIFSSRRLDNIPAIESDSFLTAALDTDSIVARRMDFMDQEILELVRPFSSSQYPFGLFRVGLSLESYIAVSRGYDRQMIVLGMVLLAAVILVLLYLRARDSRRIFRRRYTDFKNVTDSIFGQMQTGVAVVDGQGVVTVANPAFEEAFGLKVPLGCKWEELATDYRHLWSEFVNEPARADETELTLTIKGEERRLLLARSRVETSDEGDSGTVMVVYDVTSLRLLESQARRRERLSEMGDLAAGVAHEIRNPLNTISIAAQRLAKEFAPESNRDEFDSFTGQIRAETKRLNDIITRFLALAREDRGGKVTVPLADFLEDFRLLIAPEADQLGIALRIDCPDDVQIKANRDELKQVFLNLFNNAKEAISGRGGRFEIKVESAGDQAVIRVSDDGPGIPPEVREKIFAPYYTTKDAGTGLGLPTVQRIITDLGGEIELDDPIDSGAQFSISLPRF